MTTTRTVKIELDLQETEVEALRDTVAQCSLLFDAVVEICNATCTANYYTICTPSGYASLRARFPAVPSMTVQQTVKDACACVKTWNGKHRKSQWQCPAKKRGTSYPLNRRTLTIRGSLCTLSSTSGRIRTLLDLPAWFFDKYDVKTNDVQAGWVKLTGHRSHIYLVYRVPCAAQASNEVVGVDRGLYNLVALSDGSRVPSKRAMAIKRRRQHHRSKLQQKGTRSAKRRLKKVSGREKRFMRDFNHCVTKGLAERPDVGTYVLEDLGGIRSKNRGRRFNRWLSNWSYFELQTQLEYKCALTGISVVYTDPRYTSQKCSCCGVVDKRSRDKAKYLCRSCGFGMHADVNAACNIRDNHFRFQAEQGAFNRPIATA